MAATPPTTPLGLQGIDHLEFWVGNARSTAGFFASHFGFDITAYAGPETGVRDRASYVCEQGDIRFVFTGALAPESEIAEHVRLHGDGVKDVAFLVSDAEAAHRGALERGATSDREPETVEDETGKLVRASIRAYGDTRHTFVERSAYSGRFMPGYGEAPLARPCGPDVGLRIVDHVVANVEDMKPWVAFYERVLGFGEMTRFTDEDISTEYSALMSTVVEGGEGKIVLPINEPATGKRKSQIEEYLDFYRGPGVQHIALRTQDIVGAVRAMRERGVRFLRIPDTYYEDVAGRLADLDLDWRTLQELGILVDRDHDGYLLQIFTENVMDRPTVFFEIIQREGSRGFGQGNFKALFVAIEREQERRGNL
ncbi:MAG TPA: 4-hydroxyphenylpyruvate dioxygenase [Actinomycetota bacterium]|jgi:4-hydroxyphenylpyruvate dioxygenase|nr:4-hydroxyphenylpyruvate dioxygenase [Actinomycetota bacterium]